MCGYRLVAEYESTKCNLQEAGDEYGYEDDEAGQGCEDDLLPQEPYSPIIGAEEGNLPYNSEVGAYGGYQVPFEVGLLS